MVKLILSAQNLPHCVKKNCGVVERARNVSVHTSVLPLQCELAKTGVGTVTAMEPGTLSEDLVIFLWENDQKVQRDN